jgi:hypothetical protein
MAVAENQSGHHSAQRLINAELVNAAPTKHQQKPAKVFEKVCGCGTITAAANHGRKEMTDDGKVIDIYEWRPPGKPMVCGIPVMVTPTQNEKNETATKT